MGINVEVVAPRRPILSVVHGSVQIGLNRNFVTSRCMPSTFGILIGLPMSQVKKENPNLSKDFYNKWQFSAGHLGMYCSGIFSTFVKFGQEIQFDEV